MSGKNEKTRLQAALRASRGAFVAVGLFSLAINALMLTVPIYMLQIYDRVLASGNKHTLVMLTIVAVGLLVSYALLDLIRGRVMVRIGTRLDQALGRPVFSAVMLQRLRGQSLGQGQPLRDLDRLRTFLTGAGLLAFFDAPWMPFFIAVVFLFHPLLGLVALIGALVLFALAVLGDLATRGPLSEASGHSIAAGNFAESSLRNAEAVQALGMLPALYRRWSARHSQAIGLQAGASDRGGIISAAARFVRPLLQVAILGTGAMLAIDQIITPGVMIASSIMMGRALAPVEASINGWRGFVAARGAYARLNSALGAEADEAPGTPLPAPKGRLSVESLYATAPGLDKAVLENVSFALEAGQSIGIIGPSAAGKSTLARLLVGIWQPLSGHVRLDGAEVSGWDPDALGPHVGYLPQDVELFDGAVVENIARFQEPDAGKAVAAAQLAGAHEMILRLPQGYDTPIGEGGSFLSGGQSQRVGLARALYGSPALVVLDEPNANLDSEGEGALRQAIDDLKTAGTTVVVIAHRPTILASVDRLLVLRQGRVEMLGDREEVWSKYTRAGVTQVAGRTRRAAGEGPSA